MSRKLCDAHTNHRGILPLFLGSIPPIPLMSSSSFGVSPMTGSEEEIWKHFRLVNEKGNSELKL